MKTLDNQLLNEYLDNVLDAEDRARVDAWLARDAVARAQLNALRALFQQLTTAPDETLPRDFSNAIVRDIQRDTSAESHIPLIGVLSAQALLAFAAFVLALPFVESLGVWLTNGTLSNPLTRVDLASRVATTFDMTAKTVAAQITALPAVLLALGVMAIALLWLVGTGVLVQSRASSGELKR